MGRDDIWEALYLPSKHDSSLYSLIHSVDVFGDSRETGGSDDGGWRRSLRDWRWQKEFKRQSITRRCFGESFLYPPARWDGFGNVNFWGRDGWMDESREALNDVIPCWYFIFHLLEYLFTALASTFWGVFHYDLNMRTRLCRGFIDVGAHVSCGNLLFSRMTLWTNLSYRSVEVGTVTWC